ncbi:unnamed protein product [Somion occarium]|uniref:Uncharacterized protein n=1 Tax=Somion occarium TaxID=3059160 RepID=A0ABP1DIT2_9APHY
MASSHILGYSKSSRAACHGPPPCKGSTIKAGVIRYGYVNQGPYAQTVEWRHWGCVTPDILNRLAHIQLEEVRGFEDLSTQDQNKIKIAVGLRRVDPADVPASAKPEPAPQAQAAKQANGASTSAGPSQKKRKATFETQSGPSSSQPSSSQPSASQSRSPVSRGLRRITVPTATQLAEDEIIEDTGPEEVIDELYCSLKTSIVGVQYYKGLVGSGEEVRLVREPHNKYDRNAIKVENIGGTQVGHVPRNVAAKLAPLMDQGMVTVEGMMHEGNLQGFSYSLSMTIKIYGAADKRHILEPKLVWATPGQRGFTSTRDGASSSKVARRGASSASAGPSAGPSAASIVAGPLYASSSQSYASAVARPVVAQSAAQLEAAQKQAEALARAAELRDILNNLEKVDDEGRRSGLLDTLCSTGDVLNLPQHENPPGLATGDLKVNLLKHQSQALKWCIEHEYPVLPQLESDKPVQFWQLRKAGGKTFYFNLATKTPQMAPPPLGRGALCADSMGLGKTLTMLSLILATKADVPKVFSRCSLIVVPLSVLSNWEKQIEDHVQPNALTYCVYYGTGRNLTDKELQQYDVVITTYQTVVGEHAPGVGKGNGEGPSKKKQKVQRTLFDMKWKRIILDEGHNIRNPKTKMAKAVNGLEAERRWVLTGTPIINAPQDLGSILTFLRICRPLDNEDFFKRMVLRPLKNGDPNGAELLRALMSHVCIRRTKEMQDSDGNHLVPLPPVEMTVVPVALEGQAREMYDAIQELSTERFNNLLLKHGSVGSAAVQSNVLSMLTRMRQLALHPGLLPANYLEQLRAANELEDEISAPVINLKPEDRIRLQAILAQAIEDNEECPICFSILIDPRITTCAHMFCLACISEVIFRDPKCPMDRRPITTGDLVEPAPPTDLTQTPVLPSDTEEEDLDGLRSGSSAKIDQLVHLLKLTPLTEKSLVFSQFTGFLDKIAEVLEKEGISYVRFDGKMSARSRQETLAKFSIPITDEDVASIPATQPSSGRPSRQRMQSSQAVIDVGADDTNDADFVMADGRGDSDFIDDEDDAPSPAKKRKGKKKATVKTRSSGTRVLDGSAFEGENPRVMLLSLKAGALGLNLTVANNVYLWWQEGIESQAIDRCNRIGQTKPVRVYQLIAENTVESKVIDIQEKKKQLIKHAFSGIKSRETQRQKKEARLQELIELFGARQTTTQGAANDQATLDGWHAT